MLDARRITQSFTMRSSYILFMSFSIGTEPLASNAGKAAGKTSKSSKRDLSALDDIPESRGCQESKGGGKAHSHGKAEDMSAGKGSGKHFTKHEIDDPPSSFAKSKGNGSGFDNAGVCSLIARCDEYHVYKRDSCYASICTITCLTFVWLFWLRACPGCHPLPLSKRAFVPSWAQRFDRLIVGFLDRATMCPSNDCLFVKCRFNNYSIFV